jgi:hypothetical protein
MRPLLLFVLLVGGWGTGSPARAQTYRLTCWEGRPVPVSLSHQPFSKRLAVSWAGDTLFLCEYQATASVRVLGRKFLQIEYFTRCGSNCQWRTTVLLTLRHQRFHVPLQVTSAYAWDAYARPESRRYRVAWALRGGPAGPYALQARVHDEATARRGGGKAYAVDRAVTLRFDPAEQLFYSAREPTARCVPVLVEDDPANDLSGLHLVRPYVVGVVPEVPLFVTGAVPTVRLLGELYYFIQGEWYNGPERLQQDGRLSCFTKSVVQYVPRRPANQRLPHHTAMP